MVSRPSRPVRRQRCKLESCHQLFRPVRSNQLFCSTTHKDAFRFRSEAFRRTKDEVLKLVATEVPRVIAQLLPKLTRGVFLALETDPPPALIARISERVFRRVQLEGSAEFAAGMMTGGLMSRAIDAAAKAGLCDRKIGSTKPADIEAGKPEESLK